MLPHISKILKEKQGGYNCNFGIIDYLVAGIGQRWAKTASDTCTYQILTKLPNVRVLINFDVGNFPSKKKCR